MPPEVEELIRNVLGDTIAKQMNKREKIAHQAVDDTLEIGVQAIHKKGDTIDNMVKGAHAYIGNEADIAIYGGAIEHAFDKMHQSLSKTRLHKWHKRLFMRRRVVLNQKEREAATLINLGIVLAKLISDDMKERYELNPPKAKKK